MGEEQMESETVETAAVGVQTAPMVEATTPEPGQTAADGGDMAKVRELVLKAHPDVVPDLVKGGSVDELIASVEPARSAYQRIADQVRGGEGRGVAGSRGGGEHVPATLPPSDPATPTVVVQPPVVPAGGATNVVDPGDLKPTTKIQQALAARKRK